VHGVSGSPGDEKIRFFRPAGLQGHELAPDPASRVVVAGHSQGSLIAVAALLWLTPQRRTKVGLVTF